MQKDYILQQYQKALKKEQLYVPISPEELYNTMWQLTEFASLSLVPRSYNTRYLLTSDSTSYESVAGHTFLMGKIMDTELLFLYGPNFKCTIDGFTYYEVAEAIRRHDLPENVIGDKADNGNRDNKNLANIENRYWRDFSRHSPSREIDSEKKIRFLLQDQNSTFSTTTGKSIHAADKASAVFMNLCLEEKGHPPIMHLDHFDASEEERRQMQRCERHIEFDDLVFCYASEMWTMSFFDRGTYKMDYKRYFTALIIMKTIAVTGKWYSWREENHDKT